MTMQKTKKFLSVFLSVVLLLSTFVYSASAAATISGSSTIGVEFEYLDENGNAVTSVQPEQVITVNIYANVNQANQALKAAKFQVWFNSAVYEYVDGSQKWVGPATYLDSGSMTEVITSDTVYNNVAGKMTDAEKAYGWDSALYMQFVLNKTVSGSYLVQENADTPMATAQFKVKDSVAPGTAAPLGAPQATTYVKRGAVYNYVQTTNIAVPTATGVITLTTPGTEFTVVSGEEPPATSIITNGKAGIRFEKNADDSYAEKISVRTKAQIDGSTLQGLIGGITDNDAVEDKILKAGFVYIADANGTLNATTAQTVAKTKAKGESIDSHINAPVEYIQYDGTNYSFTCLITPIAQTEIATASFNSYAYIVIDVNGDGVADDGEWYFADAAGNAVSAKTLYNNNNDRAWAQYGWGTATDL